MKKTIHIFTILTLYTNIVVSQCVVKESKLISTLFYDEFETFDNTEWDIDNLCHSNIKYDQNQVSINNGKLVLSVTKSQFENSCGSVWSGGSITSKYYYPRATNQYPLNYMIFEAKVKMPIGIDVFPAFWLFSSCNEVDIFEYHDNNGNKHFTNTVHQFLNNNGCPENRPTCYRSWEKDDLDTKFHTYSVAWRVKENNLDKVDVTFFFDGKELWTQNEMQLEENIGLKIKLGNSIWHYSTQNSPTSMEVEYIKVLETSTTSITELKQEYYKYLNGEVVVSNQPNSITVLEDNQVLFNSGNWMNTYHFNSNGWNLGYVTNWQNDEIIGGEIHSNASKIYFRGADLKLHYYFYNLGWNHSYILSNKLLSPGKGIIATKGFGNSDQLIALAMRNNVYEMDYIHIYPGSGNSFTQLGNSSQESCDGDITFLGNKILYRGRDSFLHMYIPIDGYIHSWIVNSLNQRIKVRNNPGSIATYIEDEKQIFIVDENGWIISVYWANNHWNYGYLTTNFNYDELVAPSSNIEITNDASPVIIYKNIYGVMRKYFYTSSGWENHDLIDCRGNTITDVYNNIKAGANNTFFYINTSGHIKNGFWRCCENLNNCEDHSIIYRQYNEFYHVKDNNIINDNTIFIYPNPCNDIIFIETDLFLPNFDVLIYDIFGKICLTYINMNGNSIDISTLSDGVYTLKLHSSTQTPYEGSARFIKQ